MEAFPLRLECPTGCLADRPARHGNAMTVFRASEAESRTVRVLRQRRGVKGFETHPGPSFIHVSGILEIGPQLRTAVEAAHAPGAESLPATLIKSHRVIQPGQLLLRGRLGRKF